VTTLRIGQRLTHRENPDLGVGQVVSVDGRTVEVHFPAAATHLRFAASSGSLVPTEAPLGAPPVDLGLLGRLAAGRLDPVDDFALRLDSLHLRRLREAEGLGSFLGGRIRLFPHQLHVAERAVGSDPVRWLLADEVGLGKTVEACLILNRLVATGRVERCLVVAPATLTVQWLGELWRKYHQVFGLLDQERLDDVAKDFGPGFNPFDVHRRAVISIETLAENPKLTKQAVAAGIDLLVVDEAHRLRRPRGHAGNAGYRAIEPITRLGRHVLLLTATPLEDDAHGFFRLLQLLRPEEFPGDEDLAARLERRDPLPPCTSSTRRADVGGLPPRRPAPVTDLTGWDDRLRLEEELRAAPAGDALQRKRKLDRLQRALGSGAALAAVLGGTDAELRRRAEAADAADPRLAWLVQAARGWKEDGDRTLVFVAHKETLELVRTALSHRGQLASAVFHEDLTPARRDIEVAQFRAAGGPSLLVSTECGGEGRNFEFCTRLVLFDLPWNPVAVEQRIGRLDRIGRTRDVEVVYFVPPSGLGAHVAEVYGRLGLFREPLAGLEPELASLAAALESAALDQQPAAAVEDALREAQAARERVRDAAWSELHRGRYRPEMGPGILARVPADLDELNEEVATGLAERLGFGVEQHAAPRTWSIELGAESLIDGLAGVPGGSSFLGTFDRERAVAEEAVDFFATGHPLVEGLLAHLGESPLGRVTALRLKVPGASGVGLLALYAVPGGFEPLLLDARGLPLPAAVALRPLRTGRVPREVVEDPGWKGTIERLGQALPAGRRPEAVAAVVFA
jgi:ATP-dependent helicase HepA